MAASFICVTREVQWPRRHVDATSVHALHAQCVTRLCCRLTLQARTRVDQLLRLGHIVDKVEFILMGGTFMSLPPDYRDYFIRNLHDALSGERGAGFV